MNQLVENGKRIKKMVVIGIIVLLFSLVGSAYSPVFASDSSTTNQDTSFKNVYSELLAGKMVTQKQTDQASQQPTVYLTFDDGPSKNTPKVLDILKQYGIKATFFEIGELAAQYPQIVKRVVKEGHTLGNHSYNHEYQPLYSNFQNFWNQIQQSQQIFYRIAGVRPQWIRAPGGTYTNFDAFYYYYLNQAGYKVEDWNVDCADASRKGVTAEEMIQTVKKSYLPKQVVFLMHDGSGHEESVKALPAIITYFKAKGYRFAPLTNQVKPLMFRIGKLKVKWQSTRKTSFAQFKSVINEVKDQGYFYSANNQDAYDKQRQAMIQQSNEAIAASAQILNMEKTELTLRLNQKPVVLRKNQYTFHNNRFEVPLRFLIENMGGQISWNAQQRMATAHYQFYTVQYRLVENEIVVYTGGKKVQTTYMADMRVDKGTIMVPLRKTIEMLGNRIVDYNLKPLNRHVDINLQSTRLSAFNLLQMDSNV